MSYQSPLGRVLGSTVTLQDYLEEGFVGVKKVLSAVESYVKDDKQKFPRFIRKRQARRIIGEVIKISGLQEYPVEYRVIKDFCMDKVGIEIVSTSLPGITSVKEIWSLYDAVTIESIKEYSNVKDPVLLVAYKDGSAIYVDSIDGALKRADYFYNTLNFTKLPRSRKKLDRILDSEAFDFFDGVYLDTRRMELTLDGDLIKSNIKPADKLIDIILDIVREAREAA